MHCTTCKHENEPDAKFCEECGVELINACRRCGRELKAAAKFCPGCGQSTAGTDGGAAIAASASSSALPGAARDVRGYTPKHLVEKILTSRSALEGERKQVTVLFADIQGSMELAEQIDPEQWHKILDRFFQILADGAHRFEGTINQYTGDGIMALFGAPIAHEDHAQRACFAVLHLRDELRRYAEELKRKHGLSFSTRMGLNSGDVVVGKIGDDLRMDYTAQGHTVGLAQRMEQLASPGQAYLTAVTAALVEGYFALRDLGEFQLKGSREPLRVFELEGAGAARTRLDVSRMRGLSRFVGRAEEIAVLDAALERSLRGEGQVVGVVAEAGVGKSRLCFEFVEQCRRKGIAVYEAHCPAHGRTIPFLAMLELLRGYFGVTDRDSDQTVREKVAGRLLLLDRSFEEALPMVFEVFGVAASEQPALRIDPESRQRQLLGFIQQLIRTRSAREPAVILIDDLHWIDPGSDTFVAWLTETVATTRTLLLVNFRPEYEAEWTRKSYYRQVPLAPLVADAIAQLLAEILGSDASVARLPALVCERTGGNPFFTEEVIQSLIESGRLEGSKGAYRLRAPLERIEIPARVQSLLAARIDRLPSCEKRILQAAAVIGKDFTEPLLARVVEHAGEELSAGLQALRSAELVYEQALYPVVEYSFKHPLTHEVAYESQLGDQRARVHRDVAQAIQALDADKLDERASLLARHWELAGEPLEAARWNARAAERTRAADPASCVRQWRKVRELVAVCGPQHGEDLAALRMQACMRILQVGGWRLGMPLAEATALYEEGRVLGTERSDKHYLATLALAYAPVVGISTGDMRDYVPRTLEVGHLADESGDPELRCAARLIMNYAHLRYGDFASTLRFALETRELAQSDHSLGIRTIGTRLYPWSFMGSVEANLYLGRIAVARQDLERSIALSRELGDQECLGWALVLSASFEQMCGDIDNGETHALEALRIAEKVGSAFSRMVSLLKLGQARIVRQKWSEAADNLEESLAIVGESGIGREAEPEILASLADAYRGDGRLDLARETAERALALARERSTRVSEAEACLVFAGIRLAGDGAAARAEIESALDRAEQLVKECEAQGLAPFLSVERAHLADTLGNAADRSRHLEEARRVFLANGATGHAERIAGEIADISAVETEFAAISTRS